MTNTPTTVLMGVSNSGLPLGVVSDERFDAAALGALPSDSETVADNLGMRRGLDLAGVVP